MRTIRELVDAFPAVRCHHLQQIVEAQIHLELEGADAKHAHFPSEDSEPKYPVHEQALKAMRRYERVVVDYFDARNLLEIDETLGYNLEQEIFTSDQDIDRILALLQPQLSGKRPSGIPLKLERLLNATLRYSQLTNGILDQIQDS